MDVVEEGQKIGSVLVVGAGISGIQAASDLADCGFYVHLLDREPAIGGLMAKLDKTFPTDECAMCILSPKLVDCARHLNINIITYAEVTSLSGTPGNYRVTIKRKARYVDEAKCTGCGECVEVCPVQFSSEFDEGIGPRRAIHRLYPQAVPNTFVIDKRGQSPCRAACPAGVHAQGYIALIRERRFKEAAELLRRDLPLPSVCGRVCYHPCEEQCERRHVDEPVAICDLKRFVSDWALAQDEEVEPLPILHPERVAVVGSGPAGLACANELLHRGYAVTVFEAADRAGGMLRYGIPAYRLPEQVLDQEIEHLVRLGIEVQTGTPIKSVQSLLENGFRAAFVATGAPGAMPLGLPGEELEGVVDMLSFLEAARRGTLSELHGDAVIIGGGNSAMDAARTAIRLGAGQVKVVYRRSRAELPAHDWEVEEAEREGVQFEFLAAPVRLEGPSGKVERVICQRMMLGEPDESGRRRPIPIEGSEFSVPATVVIPAIGQENVPGSLGSDLETTARGRFEVDPLTLETRVPGVFSGGDAVSGAATVVEAFAAGKRAAESIDRHLRGLDLKAGRSVEPAVAPRPELSGVAQSPRAVQQKLAATESAKCFDEIVAALSEEEALAEAERCLGCGGCSECQQCVKQCEAGAIRLEDVDREDVLEVGAIILTPGFIPSDAGRKGAYGLGRYPNVITNAQFERILNASGPYAGEIRRPSDGKHPRKIAFVQCVGSRDVREGCNPYCSSICCMASIKEAVIAREHDHRIEPTIFYIDMRTHGKGFEQYFENAREKRGIVFKRSNVAKIYEKPATGNLMIRYADEDPGRIVEEEFDLVVLAVGLVVNPESQALLRALNLPAGNDGASIDALDPQPLSSVPGIFLAGRFAEPRDIPEAVTEGSRAACAASRFLAEARGSRTLKKKYPKQLDATKQPARVGVFVCHCGKNIAATVDVPEVVAYAARLPGVVHAGEFLYSCSQDALEAIQQAIRQHGLNRVVVASCTPRTHEYLFADTVRESGLNRFYFELASIREHCSWVHMEQPEQATRKAMDLVAMAVNKVRRARPVRRKYSPVVRQGLVIGGGVSGMNAALGLAEQGFPCVLVEKADRLGGNSLHRRFNWCSPDPQPYLRDRVQAIEGNPNITTCLNSEVTAFSGYLGNFKARILNRISGEESEVECGSVIVATGAVERTPSEYHYGTSERILTQTEFEQRLADEAPELAGIRNIVMIQCVGSREEPNLYCSRVCCTQAIQNALVLKKRHPDAAVYILYREIRTYGLRENLYREAREAGVVFLRYTLEDKPVVEPGPRGVRVRCKDHISMREILLDADLLVLSTGIAPRPEAEQLSRILRVPLTGDGFFLEAHAKLRPVDFSSEGLFLAGLAHSPRFLSECITQASAASVRAATILSQGKIESKAETVEVNERLCSGCGLCLAACPFDARRIDEDTGKATVNEVLCQGCGACAVACPNKATGQNLFRADQILSMLEPSAVAAGE